MRTAGWILGVAIAIWSASGVAQQPDAAPVEGSRIGLLRHVRIWIPRTRSRGALSAVSADLEATPRSVSRYIYLHMRIPLEARWRSFGAFCRSSWTKS